MLTPVSSQDNFKSLESTNLTTFGEEFPKAPVLGQLHHKTKKDPVVEPEDGLSGLFIFKSMKKTDIGSSATIIANPIKVFNSDVARPPESTVLEGSPEYTAWAGKDYALDEHTGEYFKLELVETSAGTYLVSLILLIEHTTTDWVLTGGVSETVSDNATTLSGLEADDFLQKTEFQVINSQPVPQTFARKTGSDELIFSTSSAVSQNPNSVWGFDGTENRRFLIDGLTVGRASRLSQEVNLTLSGAVTGSVAFDGSSSVVTLNTTLSNSFIPSNNGEAFGLRLTSTPSLPTDVVNVQWVNNAIATATNNVNSNAVLKNTPDMQTLQGRLELGGDATTNLGATTLQQVSALINTLQTQINQLRQTSFTIISGTGTGNGPGQTFDVFPPSGMTMANFVAFLPSVRVINYAGKVDENDTTTCSWVANADRITVTVRNSEQRTTSTANFIVVWKNFL